MEKNSAEETIPETELDKDTAIIEEADPNVKYREKMGLILFFIYGFVYSVFVAVAVFNVELMDTVVMFELNLSIFYGLGLIILAVFLAALYSLLCNLKNRATEKANNSAQKSGSI